MGGFFCPCAQFSNQSTLLIQPSREDSLPGGNGVARPTPARSMVNSPPIRLLDFSENLLHSLSTIRLR
jgi:hypothetical protein